MLGSFSSSLQYEEEEEIPVLPSHHLHYHHHIQQPPPLTITSPATQLRQLLISCAHLISQFDFSAARRLLTILSANSSLHGDSTQRLVHQFTKALTLRLNRHVTASATSTVTASNVITHLDSYLSLNQITPFIRFSQLTANQAILEAIEGQAVIHILDFDIMHGVQWPPLMQAIADRYPPPTLRITATGKNPNTLRRTGDRLSKFAQTLGLKFYFHPLLVISDEDIISMVSPYILPNETLAVNCMFYLHRLLKDRDNLLVFLHGIKAMNPKVVTLAEREANHNHPIFLQRFIEAVDHYAAVFNSLEATLPPNSGERLTVEQVWFGREISDIVAEEGEGRRERHERLRSWEVMLRSSGFEGVSLSPFALSQAKLLLRLHYPSEGYQVFSLNHCFFLGWQNQPLFAVSSWH
ncbi:scarecrow-like protein 18 [Cornus florida]|uniref:scarecrow-like protein 18 n=1 Tax=Cornus florida TaxID=4283 RepID=UPI00289774DA|nr:scarecrow-like protein 18 [Cornus florida]